MCVSQDWLERFAENVRARRLRLGLTQEVVSDRASMNISYWSRLERAKIDPGIRTIARMATALQTTPAELMTGAERPRRTTRSRGRQTRVIRLRPTRHRHRA
jgi:transcriptional regulator with XRE-family HTH domain